LESLLEEAHIKLSIFVSDLLGLSAQLMLKAIAEGETNPATLAAFADERLRTTTEQLCDALGACTELHPVYRVPGKAMALETVLSPDLWRVVRQTTQGNRPPHAGLTRLG
jgi:hypothetical protein